MTEPPTSDDLRDLIRDSTTRLCLTWVDASGVMRVSVHLIPRHIAEQIDADARKQAL